MNYQHMTAELQACPDNKARRAYLEAALANAPDGQRQAVAMAGIAALFAMFERLTHGSPTAEWASIGLAMVDAALEVEAHGQAAA